MAILAGFEPSDLYRDRVAGTAKLPHRTKLFNNALHAPRASLFVGACTMTKGADKITLLRLFCKAFVSITVSGDPK